MTEIEILKAQLDKEFEIAEMLESMMAPLLITWAIAAIILAVIV